MNSAPPSPSPARCLHLPGPGPQLPGLQLSLSVPSWPCGPVSSSSSAGSAASCVSQAFPGRPGPHAPLYPCWAHRGAGHASVPSLAGSFLSPSALWWPFLLLTGECLEHTSLRSSSLLWSSDPHFLGAIALYAACCGQLRGLSSSPVQGPSMDARPAPGLLQGHRGWRHGTRAGLWPPGAPASFRQGQNPLPRAAAPRR